MKSITVIFLIFLAQASFAQSLKKKYLGTYSGEMPAYSMDAGGVVVDVKPAKITVEIAADGITKTIGDQLQQGIYLASSPEKDYYVIEMRYTDSKVIQRFLLYRKSKELVFQGIYPQPDVVLKRTQG